ncbi:MAG: OmpH family outer membrane protein [Acidobacteria bacterium]|nr:OmpH family outer membrane protein [Acidobacteriota bacterium]
MKTAFLAAIPAAAILAFVAFSAEGQTPTAQAGTKVAYVSTQRVLNEVASARTELGRVQALQQQKTNELRTKQQAIENTRQQIASATDATARATLTKQEQDQRADFDRANQQAQADLQRLQREVQADLQARVRQAIAELSRTQNVQMVLNFDTSVVWSEPGLDLTNLLIEKLNAADAAKKP